MNKLYPIKFIADPRERVWGGDYLIKGLKKDFDEEYSNKPVGESWELWSLYGGSSVVQNGFLAGNTLDELMEIYLGDLVGENVFSYYKGDFPLLVKILDIKEKISVQVHPEDSIAMERENSYGKAEMWYIMDAKPGAKLYVGFNREVTPTELYNKCKDGTVTELLNCFTPQKGDCVYIQPGCIHAAEGEVIIAEIQQSSDISYRLYDWGRENNPQTARRMDLEDAIDVIDYSKFDAEKYYFKQVSGSKTIVDTHNFIVKTLELGSPCRIVPSLAGSFTVYMCINGSASFKMNDGTECTLTKGETLLIPASMEDFLLSPTQEGTILLEASMPQLTDGPDLYLNYDEPEDEAHGSYKDSSYDEEDFDDDDCECDDECDDNCTCSCHNHQHNHSHHHNCDCHNHGCDCTDEGHHPGESFFRK
ncbi:MAG: class I mannose-6-phosphate isomerase [Bacteroidales bacterium]|nr:class I mannose-6-phosphate isomerase [Bacteroidales bacterium]